MTETKMTHSAIAVYTGDPTETILEEGGSKSLKLNEENARKAQYCVLCFNPNSKWSKGNVDRGSAFLIGKILDVLPSPTLPERFIVLFDEYAEVNLPDIWGGWRYPIKYTSLEDLGIEIAELKFQPMPKKVDLKPNIAIQTGNNPLTVEAAKAGLALTFGVEPEAVEITIRV